MKRSRACLIWVALSPVVLAGFPAASAPQRTVAKGTPAPTRTPSHPVMAPLPLQGPLTLDSGKGPRVVPPKVDYHALRQDLQDLGNAFSNCSAQLSLIKNYVTQCRNKNKKYSVDEQVAAGCKGSDTLDQCKEKLFLHCMNTGSSAAVADHYREATQKIIDETPKVMELLKKAQARVKYEANYYDFD
jgi:hypothetical protein